MVREDKGGIPTSPEPTRLRGIVLVAGQVSAFVQAHWLGTPRKSQGPYMWKKHSVSVPLRHPRAKLETWGQAGGVAAGGVSEWVRSRPDAQWASVHSGPHMLLLLIVARKRPRLRVVFF